VWTARISLPGLGMGGLNCSDKNPDSFGLYWNFVVFAGVWWFMGGWGGFSAQSERKSERT